MDEPDSVPYHRRADVSQVAEQYHRLQEVQLNIRLQEHAAQLQAIAAGLTTSAGGAPLDHDASKALAELYRLVHVLAQPQGSLPTFVRG